MVTSGDTKTLVEAAKALRPRILAERDRIEAARRLPDDLVHELARAGFFRISLPAAYGGLDLPPTAATQVFDAVSQTNPFAQSVLAAQVVRHAPNAGSHVYGTQSKGVASSSGHFAPGPAQYAGPTPLLAVGDIRRGRLL